jgi:hypothetical protein
VATLDGRQQLITSFSDALAPKWNRSFLFIETRCLIPAHFYAMRYFARKRIRAAVRWVWEIPALARAFFPALLWLSPVEGGQHPTLDLGLAHFEPPCPAVCPSENKLLQTKRKQVK